MTSRAVVVLAKLPGRGKTRLVPAIGAAGAFELAEAMLLDTLEALEKLDPMIDRVLAIDGDYERKGWRTIAQAPGDLGARIDAARREAAADHVAIVGTDAPLKSAARVEEALARLALADAVFGPTLDGGYDLIALARAEPALLRDIPWSTERVMGETRARAGEAGRVIAELEESFDVDVPDDLDRAREALATRDPAIATRTRAVLARLLVPR